MLPTVIFIAHWSERERETLGARKGTIKQVGTLATPIKKAHGVQVHVVGTV